MSSGLNCFCRSRTLVDSAPPGSQAELSFFSTPVSLPASGAARASTTTQNPRTTHLVQRPQTSLANPPVAIAPSPPLCADGADIRAVGTAGPTLISLVS